MPRRPHVSSSTLASFDPFSDAFHQDPHRFYDAMRAASPAWLYEPRGMYFVTRYDLIQAILRDTATFSSAYGVNANEPPAPHIAAQIAEIKSAGWVRPATMLTVDPPAHTRYRGTVAKAFNARVVTALRPAIEEIIDEEIDRFIDQGSVNMKKMFSETVPVRVIVKTLNLPEDSQADIKRWSDDTTAGIGAHLPDDRAIEAAHGVVELQRFMVAEITKRLEHPSDDIIGMLVEADLPLDDGTVRKLILEEAMGILQALIGAGNETTTKLFSQMLLYLAENPDQWRRLKADPTRAAAIAEESLRLSTPTQGLYRVTTTETQIDGVPIPKGARVFIAFAAGNRDPAVFPNPHEFDPDRPNVRDHLALGGGVHFCLGAPLARLETVVALEKLAQRWESFTLSSGSTVAFEPSFVLRGLTELNIDFVRAPA
jgi:cytochrome P450